VDLVGALTALRDQRRTLIARYPRLPVDDLRIRRDDLLSLRRAGTVRWFKDEKGYGRITADDGEVLFVHFTGIAGEGFRSLEEGQRVSFVWDGSEAAHGRHVAVDVRLEGDHGGTLG
jgi:cold shock CspA family protein